MDTTSFIDLLIEEKYGQDELTHSIIDGDQFLSYKEFVDGYKSLAQQIDKNHLSKENGVILFIDKSIEASIGMFGILNAGSFYIPVDIHLPDDRLKYIIGVSQSKLILVNEESLEKLNGLELDASIDVLKLKLKEDKTIDFTLIKKADKEIKHTSIAESRKVSDLAYIIFTSGSTGLPKAVMITHENLNAFLDSCDATEIFKNTLHINYLSICPWYFDGSISDIFCTLKDGGSLILLRRLTNPNTIPEYIERYKITHTLMLSSVVKIFANEYSRLEKYNLESLEVLWYGGEPCPVSFIKRVKEFMPKIMFVHGYGPTELTHTSTWLIYKDIPESDSPYLQIGLPLKNIEHFIVSDENQLIEKPNEVGELYLGGQQLMKGYFADENRTKEAIIEYPVGSGKMVYKSGDYVFFNEKNELIFHGRKDDLVKHNGYLVSLIEIEKKALEMEEVADAIAVFQKNELYSSIILGILGNDSFDITTETVKKYLKNKIPAYMIPDRIMILEQESILYTNNGKLDKNHLKNNLLTLSN